MGAYCTSDDFLECLKPRSYLTLRHMEALDKIRLPIYGKGHEEVMHMKLVFVVQWRGASLRHISLTVFLLLLIPSL